jgi:hypothetical protein
MNGVTFFQVLGSPNEFHFVHRAMPHARSKRSVPHTRRLKVDPLVSGKLRFTTAMLHAPVMGSHFIYSWKTTSWIELIMKSLEP